MTNDLMTNDAKQMTNDAKANDQKMKNITVIGSGTMGNGIAHTFAQFGFDVALVDVNREALDRAMQTITAHLERQVKKEVIDDTLKLAALNRIKTFTELSDGVKNADLVVEAATENKEVKLTCSGS
jgi:3-hydroxybutyryl-CoA dehydrogenase